MPRAGSYRLSDLPPTYQVILACDHCGRGGQYRVATLIERFGADCSIPDVKNRLAVDCPKQIAGHASDPCGVTFENRWPWG